LPVPGGDLAGTVEHVGSAATAFKLDDEAYRFGTGASCTNQLAVNSYYQPR